MTFQRFMAEWEEQNARICGNRAESTCGASAGFSIPQQDLDAKRHDIPAKRKNADNFKGEIQ